MWNPRSSVAPSEPTHRPGAHPPALRSLDLGAGIGRCWDRHPGQIQPASRSLYWILSCPVCLGTWNISRFPVQLAGTRPRSPRQRERERDNQLLHTAARAAVAATAGVNRPPLQPDRLLHRQTSAVECAGHACCRGVRRGWSPTWTAALVPFSLTGTLARPERQASLHHGGDVALELRRVAAARRETRGAKSGGLMWAELQSLGLTLLSASCDWLPVQPVAVVPCNIYFAST